jgi:lysophospholipase L1-like esterase
VTGGGGGPIDLRLQRDVIAYKPTVMTIMLGMNDGGYRAFDQGLFDTYTTGYTHILDTVRKAMPGLRLTLIQPSPYDDVTRAPGFPGGYNATLIRYGDFVKDTALKDGQRVADFTTPMDAMLQKANATDPALAQKVLPDRVHPSPAGHLVMAEALLKAWNAPSLVAGVGIDAAHGKVTRADNAKITGLKTGATVAWDETDGSLPMIVDPTDPLVQLVLKSSDVTDTLNQEPLTVTGLDPATHYTLNIDGSDVADLTGDQLAQGVNLATLPTPMAQQAQTVLALTRQHGDQHSERWRNFQVPLQDRSPAVQAGLKPLLAALDADEEKTVLKQRAAAQPVPHHYTLAVAALPPTGPNLAQGKPYDTSDPNTHNYGLGGLTDGSWAADSQHTFATNETDVFPKTATIDLGAATQIGAVVLGVPPFGSTKTIAVSVSIDGKKFTDVGRYVFSLRREQKHVYAFPAVSARYVRLTYPDHSDENVGYDPHFVFTNEAEVYGPQGK